MCGLYSGLDIGVGWFEGREHPAAVSAGLQDATTQYFKYYLCSAVKEDDTWVDSEPTPADVTGTSRHSLLVLSSLPHSDSVHQQQRLSAGCVDCRLGHHSETCTQTEVIRNGTQGAQPTYPLGHPAASEVCKGHEGASMHFRVAWLTSLASWFHLATCIRNLCFGLSLIHI